MVDWRAYLEEKHDWLLRVCRSVTRDDDKAYEAMSEPVVDWLPRILERWDDGRDESVRAPLDAWVRYNIRWKVFQWLQKRDRPAWLLSLDASDLTFAEAVDLTVPEHERDAEIEHVRHAFARLEPADRDFLVMSVVMGLSMREMSERCGMALGSVHAAVDRARDNLRREIER